MSNAKPEPFWIERIAAGHAPRLRNEGESVEDYRVAMGWDKPATPEGDPRKQAAILLNRLVLMVSAKATQEPDTPPDERITDAEVDALESQILALFGPRIDGVGGKSHQCIPQSHVDGGGKP